MSEEAPSYNVQTSGHSIEYKNRIIFVKSTTNHATLQDMYEYSQALRTIIRDSGVRGRVLVEVSKVGWMDSDALRYWAQHTSADLFAKFALVSNNWLILILHAFNDFIYFLTKPRGKHVRKFAEHKFFVNRNKAIAWLQKDMTRDLARDPYLPPKR